MSAEVAVRLSLLGHSLPKTSMPLEFRLVPHGEGEVMEAYEAEERKKVLAGAALAQRATLLADVAAADALAAFFSKDGGAAAAAAATLPSSRAASSSSSLAAENGPPLQPTNRTAADVWVLDQLPTWEALPESLQLLNSSRDAKNFRRLHPAMLQNVWDVQRLITGLLNTPAFLRPHSFHKHGHASGHYFYHTHRARDKYRTRSIRDILSQRNSLRAAEKANAAAAATAAGSSQGSDSEAAIAVPITDLQAQMLQGYGNDGSTNSESSSSSKSKLATATRQPFCTCGATLTVKNAHVCAPTQPLTEKSPERPLGYPFKGRLGHWATPCDYRADSL